MSEVEKVVKKWSKDELIAFVVEHASWRWRGDEAEMLELWRLNRELKVAGDMAKGLRERQDAALVRGDFAGFEAIERLLLSARTRESDAFHKLMSIYDRRQARRDFEERRRAKTSPPPPPPAPSRELVLVPPTHASDPEVFDAELVEDEPRPLPKPRLGLPAPRRSLPMQQRRK